MEDLFAAITNLGFPIAVAAYLLVRFERKIDNLTDTINGRDGLSQEIRFLKQAIKELNQKLDK